MCPAADGNSSTNPPSLNNNPHQPRYGSLHPLPHTRARLPPASLPPSPPPPPLPCPLCSASLAWFCFVLAGPHSPATPLPTPIPTRALDGGCDVVLAEARLQLRQRQLQRPSALARHLCTTTSSSSGSSSNGSSSSSGGGGRGRQVGHAVLRDPLLGSAPCMGLPGPAPRAGANATPRDATPAHLTPAPASPHLTPPTRLSPQTHTRPPPPHPHLQAVVLGVDCGHWQVVAHEEDVGGRDGAGGKQGARGLAWRGEGVGEGVVRRGGRCVDKAEGGERR